MKKIILRANYFCFTLPLLATLLFGCSCTATKPTPDPLAGWKLIGFESPNKTIADDYKDYVQKLSVEEKNGLGSIQFFEDGAGQNAVRIEIALNGADWAHVLIYDKTNKRIKVIKYAIGRYAS
jgi:hypothetical protein